MVIIAALAPPTVHRESHWVLHGGVLLVWCVFQELAPDFSLLLCVCDCVRDVASDRNMDRFIA